MLATGGGAFMNAGHPRTDRREGRFSLAQAEFEVLMRRIKRRHDRPLLKTDDPGTTLRELMEARYPVYAEADLTVQSREVPHERIVDEIVTALAGHLGEARPAAREAAEGEHVS